MKMTGGKKKAHKTPKAKGEVAERGMMGGQHKSRIADQPAKGTGWESPSMKRPC